MKRMGSEVILYKRPSLHRVILNSANRPSTSSSNSSRVPSSISKSKSLNKRQSPRKKQSTISTRLSISQILTVHSYRLSVGWRAFTSAPIVPWGANQDQPTFQSPLHIFKHNKPTRLAVLLQIQRFDPLLFGIALGELEPVGVFQESRESVNSEDRQNPA